MSESEPPVHRVATPLSKDLGGSPSKPHSRGRGNGRSRSHVDHGTTRVSCHEGVGGPWWKTSRPWRLMGDFETHPILITT
jgi:hypothetical protein